VQWERIADVNLNRLNESLKFIEDIIRFVIIDRGLLDQVRHLRQEFLVVKKALPIAGIMCFRDSQKDLGRKSGFDSAAKKNMVDLVITNFTRAKESSRILEETMKCVYPKVSNKVKKIRFQLYDIEKLFINYFARIFDPSLCVVLDEKYVKRHRLKQVIGVLKKNRATMIQLRIKSLSDRIFYDYARVVMDNLKSCDIKFIINNRLDIALACGADGVHLGQEDMPIAVARRALGDGSIIGASAHNLAEARKAEKDGADYIGVGSIFTTKTKPDAKTCGLQRLRAICKAASIPVVGIGGITADNYKSVRRAGASGIAVSSFLFEGNLKNNLHSLTGDK